MRSSRDFMSREMLSEQYLLGKNQVYLFGPIETGMASRIIPQMHYIEQKMIEENLPEEERVLTLLINSPGGSVSDGLAIYDTINSLSCDVRTICVGLAASMGAFLLSSGTRGMRLALPHSEILIHQPLGGAQGQALTEEEGHQDAQPGDGKSIAQGDEPNIVLKADGADQHTDAEQDPKIER